MAEFKYVSLPTVSKQVRSDDVEEYASAELNEKWVAEGWEPVSVSRPQAIGPIGFLLRRD
jgi:hypothetical protein